MTTRIYVDVQAVQGPFHERGIARYVSDLAAALERAGAPIAAFGLNPTQPAPANLHHSLLASPRLTWNTAANFEALLADGPLVYLMLSPFEGYDVTDSVWPPYVMESVCPIVGVVYDVIPYQDPVTYQPDRTYEEFFRARRDLLAHFEHYLAISDSAAYEFANEFAVDPAAHFHHRHRGRIALRPGHRHAPSTRMAPLAPAGDRAPVRAVRGRPG